MRRWVLQADVDDGFPDGVTSAEHAEIKRFRTQNKSLREDFAILKAATSFFVVELENGAITPRLAGRDEQGNIIVRDDENRTLVACEIGPETTPQPTVGHSRCC